LVFFFGLFCFFSPTSEPQYTTVSEFHDVALFDSAVGDVDKIAESVNAARRVMVTGRLCQNDREDQNGVRRRQSVRFEIWFVFFFWFFLRSSVSPSPPLTTPIYTSRAQYIRPGRTDSVVPIFTARVVNRMAGHEDGGNGGNGGDGGWDGGKTPMHEFQ
jgi:hypothetical protein